MTMHTRPGAYRVKDSTRVDDAADLNAIMAALKKRDEEIQAFATKASAEIKDTGKIAAETKAALDKITESASGLQARMLELEQKLARRPGGGGQAVKSLGERFIESDEYKEIAAKGGGRARINVKASTITSEVLGGSPPGPDGAAGALIRPDRLPGIVTPAQREMTIRDLLLPGRTSSNAIEYVKETGFTNAAAPVAENPQAVKPQSDLTFDLVTRPVRTIAHHIVASKQVLADAPMLSSYIDTRLRYGLKYVEENQILNGDGNGENLHGLIPQAFAYDLGGALGLAHMSDKRVDTIRKAALQVRLSNIRATFIVLNPIDWAEIELTKDAEQRYIMVTIPLAGADMRVWRLAVIETTAIDPGKFLVGAGDAAQVFDREDVSVEVSTEHSDYFLKNKAAILCEERLTLACYRPESFVYGDFPAGVGEG